MNKVKRFMNGNVVTMERKGEVIEAFIVRDGRFLACGTNEEMRKIHADEEIDLGGKTVLPGLIDTHQHVISYTESLETVDLRNAKNWQEVKERLIERAKNTPKGMWVQGRRFNHETWEDPTLPDKQELDTISKDHPILISRYCMHVHVANTLALDIAGIDKEYARTAPDNSVVTDENGEATGVLLENAVSPVLCKIPPYFPTKKELKDAVYEVIKEMNRYGLTSIHPIQGKFCDAVEYMWLYQELDAENRLPIRAYVSFDEYPNLGIQTGFGNEKVKYGFYKIYSDGSLGSRGAKLFEPYADDPTTTGVLNYTQEEFNSMCQKAYDKDLQIAMHAIGDEGLTICVNCIEELYYKNPKPNQRFRLIHVMCLNEDLIARMKKLPVVLDIQPKFVSSNVKWSEDRLGPERAKLSYAWRRLIDEGFILTGGCDTPVEPINPFLSIYGGVTRKDMDGYPEGGWHPEQCITVYEAIEMYTKNAAYASFEEDIKGTIKEEKLADFIVLDRNPLDIDPDDLKNVKVLNTYFAGDEVYKAE